MLLSASFLVSSGLVSDFCLSLDALFLDFFTDPLERDEDESEELEELDVDDDESDDELLDDLELELELLLLDDLELLLDELSLLESRRFLPLSLESFLASLDFPASSPAFRSLRSPVSLSGLSKKHAIFSTFSTFHSLNASFIQGCLR